MVSPAHPSIPSAPPVAGRAQRAVSLRSERSMSRGFPSLELDTVLEERSDPEQTQVGGNRNYHSLRLSAVSADKEWATVNQTQRRF